MDLLKQKITYIHNHTLKHNIFGGMQSVLPKHRLTFDVAEVLRLATVAPLPPQPPPDDTLPWSPLLPSARPVPPLSWWLCPVALPVGPATIGLRPVMATVSSVVAAEDEDDDDDDDEDTDESVVLIELVVS